MSGVLRSGVRRLVASTPSSSLLKCAVPAVQQAAHISGKVVRSLENRKLPKPYDYTNKDYTFWHALFDKTTHRLDENSKVSE